MKYLLLIPVFLCCHSLSAQNNDFFNPDNRFKRPKDLNKLIPVKPLQGISADQAILSHVLPGGNKFYLLPQDNMPCIVPNMDQWNNMPNAAPRIPYTVHHGLPGDQPGLIPNPGLKSLPLIPGRKR